MDISSPPIQPIIFTDLDGTLLELDSYAITTVATTVEQATAKGIPVVFCSSKTAPEQVIYRQALRLDTPFIVENGAAIFIPESYFEFEFPYQKLATYYSETFKVIELGLEVTKIRAILASLRLKLGLNFQGYTDLALSDICRLTGLDLDAAQRACQRDYSETILQWHVTDNDSSLQAKQIMLNQHLAMNGCQGVSGSKFYTISGVGSDKGEAVRRLTQLFQTQYHHLTTLGLGDGLNDAPMFMAVDNAFLVQKPNGQWTEINLTNLTQVAAIGPKGWCQVVQHLIQIMD